MRKFTPIIFVYALSVLNVFGSAENVISLAVEGDTLIKDRFVQYFESDPLLQVGADGFNYYIRIVEPDPSINYTIIIIEPDPDIDYKIRILDPVTHSDSPGMSSSIVESIRDALESIVQEIAK